MAECYTLRLQASISAFRKEDVLRRMIGLSEHTRFSTVASSFNSDGTTSITLAYTATALLSGFLLNIE